MDHFSKLAHFPDPMPGEDGHYKKFEEVFATDTVEEHRPSLQKITKKRLPFYPSIQHVRNCNTMLQCDEYGMWRLVYANRKLKAAEIRKFRGTLDAYPSLVVQICRKLVYHLNWMEWCM